MIKWVATVKRHPTMAVDELRTWWLGKHALIAKKLPGLKKYVVSLTLAIGEEEPEYDGIAELWFDSVDDLGKALHSPVFTELRNDIDEHKIIVTRIFTEEHFIV